MILQTDSTLGAVKSNLRGALKWTCLSTTLLIFQGIALPTHATDIMVAAAASLTDAFTEIGKAYEKATRDTRVLFNFAPSGELLEQIANGAPEDVFAAADPVTMEL